MPTSHQLGSHLLQLRPHPLCYGDAPEPERSVLGPSTNTDEAEERERLGFAKATGFPVTGRVAPELDEPRLVRVQLQVELRKMPRPGDLQIAGRSGTLPSDSTGLPRIEANPRQS